MKNIISSLAIKATIYTSIFIVAVGVVCAVIVLSPFVVYEMIAKLNK